jgi:RsiW-degrading membrane proteinase PrsW (M82 family)
VDLAQTVLAILVAVGIPSAFLLIIYTLDLYASRTFHLVMLCFTWGAVGAYGLSYGINTYIMVPVPPLIAVPLVEEILKALALSSVSRRPEFTYFVDGAIYGFATGIGFSIFENFQYIQQNPRLAILIAIVRSFSTCLMHGTATALVGTAIGRFRFRKRVGRGLALFAGWTIAILLHALFNGIVEHNTISQILKIPILVCIGLGGVGLVALFIKMGLREQRQWILDALDRSAGVTGAEAQAAGSLASIDKVLKPITKQFPDKAEQALSLLRLQAKMGIRRRVQQRSDDPWQEAQLGKEIVQLQTEMERLRKEIGPYVMAYLRAVFPGDMGALWARLDTLATRSAPPEPQRWAAMLAQREDLSRPSLFDQLNGGEGDDESRQS